MTSRPLPVRLWVNAHVYTGESPSASLATGQILTEGEIITAIGPSLSSPPGAEVIDCGGRLVTPALIDCHTHLVHGGNRAHEFEMRLGGASYADIAQAGGGIVSTMRATREADVETLVSQALPRLDRLIGEAVSTVEIKSGYGLSIDAELNMLRAARKLALLRPVRIVTTWLAAHALPPEYKDRRAAYFDEVVLPGLHQAKAEGLVDAVDGFCETIAFTAAEIERLFAYAGKLGLPVKLHAEQLSNQNGAALAARYAALSADHLEWLTMENAQAMAAAGTVAVLLPGAFYMLRETKLPPVAALRQKGTSIAVATDCNPGTSPMTSLLMAMNMAAVLFGLTVGECVHGVTGAAAKALGLSGRTGTLVPGRSADIAVWNAASLAELVNPIGLNPLYAHYFKGEKISA